MKKYVFFQALICFCLAWADGAFAETLVIKDLVGREVQVPRDPKKIVGIGPGALRLLVYLQAVDKVAGVEKMEKMHGQGRPYWLAWPELADRPECGFGGPSAIHKKPDLEAIMAINPQVVFATFLDASLADEAQKSSGIPFVVLSYGESGGMNDVLSESLKVAGRVLHREKRANDLLFYFDLLKKDLAHRAKAVPANQPPSVYAGGIGYKGTFGLESTEKNYLPFSWVNANNLSNSLETQIGTHLFLDSETVLEMNPDIIFIDGGGLALVTEDFFKKPEYYFSLKAFAEKKVYTLLPLNGYAANLCTALADAYAVGKTLHPEAFKDVDLEKKADEIYTFLVGKPVYGTMKKDYGALGDLPSFLKPEE